MPEDVLVYAEPMTLGTPVTAGMLQDNPQEWLFRSEQGQRIEWVMGVFALDLIQALYPGYVFDGLRLPDNRFLVLDVLSLAVFRAHQPGPPLYERKRALGDMVTHMMGFWSNYAHWAAPPVLTVPGFMAYHPTETFQASKVWEESGYSGVQLVRPDAPYCYPNWWRPNKEKS